MNTVKVYQLDHLSSKMFRRLEAAQMEAAQVWNRCMELHKEARQEHGKWPGRNELQKATKSKFALHSQSVQMIVHAFLANILCPRCGHKHKPKGRNWACRACGFTGHRDLVGSINMHRLAYGSQVMFPRSFTYLRPGLSRSSSRRADTPLCCPGESHEQPRLVETVPSETGPSCDVA